MRQGSEIEKDVSCLWFATRAAQREAIDWLNKRRFKTTDTTKKYTQKSVGEAVLEGQQRKMAERRIDKG